MKIYAKQIQPEYQESPLFFVDFWPENVHVYGNRDYNEHGNYFDTVQAINNFSEDIDDIRSGCGWYTGESLEKMMQDYFPRKNPYTRAERLHALDLAREFFNAREYSDDERAAVIAFMEMRDGIKYACGTIRGCCQGDWQSIIYPAEYGREWLECFETEYFNTGTEWIVHDGNAAPDSPEDIDGFTMYAHGWSDEQIKKEIADAYGAPDAEVILYKFTGWSRTAEYMEV